MKVIFIILIYVVVKAEDSVSKYIDLLPEEEKDAFLDRVARRILAAVPASNSNNNPKTSVELLDDQLKEHDEFVTKILKEEALNLRKNGSAKNDTEPKKNEKTDVRTYVDLTLRTDHRTKREDSRKVYTGYSPDNENGVEQENSNESDVKEDIQVKNFRRSKEEPNVNNEKEENIQTQTDLDSDTSSHGAITIEKNVKTENENKDIIKSIRDDQNYVESTNTDISKISNQISNTSIKNIESVGYTDNITKSSSSRTTEFPTIKTNDLHVANTETSTATTINLNDEENKEDDTVKKIDDSKIINLEINSANESVAASDTEFPFTTETVIATITLKPDADINESNYLTTSKIEVIATTTLPLIDVNFNAKANEKRSAKTIEALESSNKRNEKKFNGKKISKVSINLENSAPKLLRQKNYNNKGSEYFKSLKNEYDKNQHKVYKIYEISPDAVPFAKVKSLKAKDNPKVTREPKPVEQPYYVPIYNYSPNNAFYSPHNIFGPNGDSDNENENKGMNDNDNSGVMSDIGDKYKNNNKMVKNVPMNTKHIEWDYYLYNDPHLRKFRLVGPKEKELNTAEPYKINSPVTKSPGKHNFNGYLDYYYVPAKKEAISRARYHKDCSSDSETSESVESTTQFQENYDSIGFIRKLLLEKKFFNFIKPIQIVHTPDPDFANYTVTEAPESKHYLRSKEKKSNKNPTHNSKNIAVDYYYSGSRFNSKEDAERIGYAKVYNRSEFLIPLLTYQVKVNLDTNNSTELNSSSQNNKVKLHNNDGGNNKNIVLPLEKYKERLNENDNTDYDLIKKILTIVPSAEIMSTFEKLLKLNLNKKTTRSRARNEIDVFANVLDDMVRGNNRALVQYNWLETTVDLLSASKKLEDMIESFHNSESIHPSDLELLKYLVYIHAMAKEELLESIMGKELRAMLLPRNKKKKKEFIKEKGLLQRVWLVRMKHEMQIPSDDLEEFEEFLADLQKALYDLHTAIKYVSMVTTFKNQNWFEDLKHVRIGTNRKQLLQIILHLCTSRIFALVEESAKNGLEDDYLSYINKNEKEFNRTKEEFVFVLKLLDEINSMK